MATSPRSRALLPLLALGIACASAATRPPRDAGAWTVESYRVELAPDFETRSISGVTTLSVVAAADVTEVRVPLGALVVERVTAGEEPLAFAQRDGVLTVALRGARRAAAAELRVEYHGTGAKGLVWGERSIHTTFFACQWMVCDQDRPGERSRLALELVVPEGLDVVASGRELAARPEPGGRVRHVWTQERPYPDYLFGFAVGRFTHVSLDARPPGLDVVAEGETPERLRVLFADTARMRAFFEERAGVPLPHRYTQVLVPGAEAQEASSLSFVGRDYVEPVLADPHEDWAIAHELAHQWWGNLVTCASWRHFWLNEGLTTFMVAAYKEARWGRGDYERELELARASHRRAVDAGFDVPLAYADPYPSLRIKRAITYSKGALFLDLLRRTVGERAFWEGIRRYTTSNAGRSVESRDFQRAMEAASEADLSALFAEWVYGA